MRHGERGQAIVETVIFLPMFLLVLFGVMWSIKSALQYERVEGAVRYAGLISDHASPYLDTSMYSMYQQLGSTTLAPLPCISPLPAPLSDADPTYTSASTTTASGAFWAPASSTPGCSGNRVIGASAGSGGFYQDVLFMQQHPSMASTVSVPSYLQAKLGTSTTFAADGYFLKPITVAAILACYPVLNTTIGYSLQYTTDLSTAVTPTPMPNVVRATTLSANTSCASY
jgi:hypothetical protein